MKPLFKVGSKVTIKDIGNDDDYDYPFSFVSGMQIYKNETFEVVEVRPCYTNFSSRKYYDKHDGCEYKLNVPDHWSWSSSMFQETYEL